MALHDSLLASSFRTWAISLLVLLSLAIVPCVRGHGYVIKPVNRASLWRLKIHGAIVDYDDNQLFCGGFQRQWNFNNGHCGLCGDDYALPRPRPYENMGARSRGIVVNSYEEGGILPVVVTITASHKGYFVFHLCPLKSDEDMEEEGCFNKYPLQLADGSGYRYHLDTWESGDYGTKLKLPKGLTCDRCVLQWHYTAGNSWGKCEDGTEAVGCGPQETFRTCSDIAILPKGQADQPALDEHKLPGFGQSLSLAYGNVTAEGYHPIEKTTTISPVGSWIEKTRSNTPPTTKKKRPFLPPYRHVVPFNRLY